MPNSLLGTAYGQIPLRGVWPPPCLCRQFGHISSLRFGVSFGLGPPLCLGASPSLGLALGFGSPCGFLFAPFGFGLPCGFFTRSGLGTSDDILGVSSGCLFARSFLSASFGLGASCCLSPAPGLGLRIGLSAASGPGMTVCFSGR